MRRKLNASCALSSRATPSNGCFSAAYHRKRSNNANSHGEIIATYADDTPYPSACSSLGSKHTGQPIRTVIARDEETRKLRGEYTVYNPILQLWDSVLSNRGNNHEMQPLQNRSNPPRENHSHPGAKKA